MDLSSFLLDFIQAKWKDYWPLFLLAGVVAMLNMAIPFISKLAHLQVVLVYLLVNILVIWVGIKVYNKYQKHQLSTSGKDLETTGVLYYPSRYNSSKPLPDIEIELKDSHTVYALWYGGQKARSAGLYHSGKIKKLLLIAPENNYKTDIAQFISRNYKGYDSKKVADELLETAKVAIKNGINVKALEEIPRYLFIVSNPFSRDAWIRIEEFNLDTKYDRWHSFKVYKDKQEYLFDTLFSYYKDYWQKGKKRKWEELNELMT